MDSTGWNCEFEPIAHAHDSFEAKCGHQDRDLQDQPAASGLAPETTVISRLACQCRHFLMLCTILSSFQFRYKHAMSIVCCRISAPYHKDRRGNCRAPAASS